MDEAEAQQAQLDTPADRQWRRQFAHWLALTTQPRTHRLAQTGVWTVRVVRWRAQTRERLSHIQLAIAQMEPLLRLPFAAFSLPSLGQSRATSEPQSDEYTPAQEARARIIVNPASGSVHGMDGVRELRETAQWLSEHGLPTELRLTQRPGHGIELAQEAVAQELEMVIAAGGDGTVNDVVQALVNHTTALGVLPMGTVNVWAREMGIGLNATDAREALLHGVRRKVDVGRAGTRYFLMMAGIGFDAEVARRVEHSLLKRMGLKLLDYLATVGLLSITHKPATIRMRREGKRRATKALMVILGNTRLYGGAMTFTKRAIADDGWLDMVVVQDGGLAHRLGVLGRALMRRPAVGPKVRYSRIESVRLEADGDVPVQVDGEVIGSLPMTFSIVPQALNVIVPADAPADLFIHAPIAESR